MSPVCVRALHELLSQTWRVELDAKFVLATMGVCTDDLHKMSSGAIVRTWAHCSLGLVWDEAVVRESIRHDIMNTRSKEDVEQQWAMVVPDALMCLSALFENRHVVIGADATHDKLTPDEFALVCTMVHYVQYVFHALTLPLRMAQYAPHGRVTVIIKPIPCVAIAVPAVPVPGGRGLPVCVRELQQLLSKPRAVSFSPAYVRAMLGDDDACVLSSGAIVRLINQYFAAHQSEH
jgi:hypothetical protein